MDKFYSNFFQFSSEYTLTAIIIIILFFCYLVYNVVLSKVTIVGHYVQLYPLHLEECINIADVKQMSVK